MSFVDSFIAEILTLEIELNRAYVRLDAGADSNALHDFRTNLRRIRSLLRPLRKIESIVPLSEAAAEVGRLTTPVRDLEVLIAELEAQGGRVQANVRKVALQANCGYLLKSDSIEQLFQQLNEWPSAFRSAEREGQLGHIKRKTSRYLDKRLECLRAALADPDYDRHQLRILVKHIRYLAEAFPKNSSLSRETVALLKAVQSTLGSWHDYGQWSLMAEHEKDLQHFAPVWRAASEVALAKAEGQFAELLNML